MTNQERNQVLKMIEQGKITPAQGLTLMQALDQQGLDAETVTVPGAPPVEEPLSTPPAQTPDPDPYLEHLKSTARRLWQIPLWAGVFITILSALGMYAILRGPGTNFWFYFLLLPLLLGVALTVLAAGSRAALDLRGCAPKAWRIPAPHFPGLSPATQFNRLVSAHLWPMDPRPATDQCGRNHPGHAERI